MRYYPCGRTIPLITLALFSAALCFVCAGTAIAAGEADLSLSAVPSSPPAGIGRCGDGISEEHSPADHLLSDDEMELLARVISAEARGEPYDGQVAVGAVVLNRMEHPGFPDSLSGVCYQPGAFSGVADGQIDISPSESCLLAAADAASGRDPTGGAVFFYNPDRAADSWIRSRQVVAVIGEHCFCV